MGLIFKSKKSASFGVETIKEFTFPYTLVKLTSNFTHIRLQPQTLDSIRNPKATPNWVPCPVPELYSS